MNMFWAILALTVQTAPKGQVYNDQPIVTNVVLDASAFASGKDIDALRDTLQNGIVNRAASIGSANAWVDATGAVWRVESGTTNYIGKVALVQDIDAVKDTLATNLVKTVINSGTYNLTYDPVLKVTWKKVAEDGVFYEKCYTNINMIGVSE